MELIIIPLCTVRETKRAIVVLSIVGGVEATWSSLADGTEQRAVVHLYHFGFIASYNHGCWTEIPRSTVISRIEQIVIRSSTPIAAVGNGIVVGCQGLCWDKVHQYAVGCIKTLTGSDEVVIETVATSSTNSRGVLNSACGIKIYGRITLTTAPRYTIVRTGGHTYMFLTIEVTEIARSKEAVEFTILTLDEARVTITTPIIIGSTHAFSNGNRSAPGLTTIGRATHHDVNNVTATNISVALITLVSGNYDATVISNNHCWDAIDTTTIVAWQERIRMSIENHCSSICRIAYSR